MADFHNLVGAALNARTQGRDFAALSASRFEESTVKRILRHFNAADWAVKQLIKLHKEKFDGPPRLGFSLFAERFPGFPFRMRSAGAFNPPLHADPRCNMASLLLRFSATPFVEKFVEAVGQAEGEDERTLMVFPRRGVAGGLTVMLTETCDVLPVGASALVQKLELDEDGTTGFVVVQSLDNVLTYIKDSVGWQPEET